jgi:hypothetical protein
MKICHLCYREFPDDFVFHNYCRKCLDIIGKGPGYKDYVPEKEAEEWLKGWKERKEGLKARGLLDED